MSEDRGFDLRRDGQRASFCRLPGAARKFVLVVGGQIRHDAIEVMAAESASVIEHDPASQSPIIARGSTWMSRRSTTDGHDELLISNSRELLQVALNDAGGSYPFDSGAAVSIVVDGADLPSHAIDGSQTSPAELKATRTVVLSMPADRSFVLARFLVGDAALAQKLAHSLRPIVDSLADKLGRATQTSPRVTTQAEGSDVVARVELPAGALELAASSLASAYDRSLSRR